VKRIIINCPRCNYPSECKVLTVDRNGNMFVEFTCKRCGYRFKGTI